MWIWLTPYQKKCSSHHSQRGNFTLASHPVHVSNAYFMTAAEGFPNSGLCRSFTLQLWDYSWLFLLAHRPSRCSSAWTIYHVKGLIYQSQRSFVLPVSVLPSHMALSLECVLVGFPAVIWNATVYQASSLFLKIRHCGMKSYFIGNDNHKVDRFLDHCFIMFPACLLTVSLAVSSQSTYLSTSLILKTGLL